MAHDVEVLRAELGNVLQAGDATQGTKLAQEALESGLPPDTLFLEVIQPVLYEVGKRFERLDTFLPELMRAAKVIQAIHHEVVAPAIETESGEARKSGTVVIGTCKGDIHDIGKNMVVLMLQVNGFEVIDLGTNVSAQHFIEAARQHRADIVGMSSLLTPSMPYMREFIERLEGLGLRDKYRVVVGGAPVTEAYAERIGADAYGADAAHAVGVCSKLMGHLT